MQFFLVSIIGLLGNQSENETKFKFDVIRLDPFWICFGWGEWILNASRLYWLLLKLEGQTLVYGLLLKFFKAVLKRVSKISYTYIYRFILPN